MSSYEPFGDIVRIGADQAKWKTDNSLSSITDGNYLFKEDLTNGGYVLQAINGDGSFGTSTPISESIAYELEETSYHLQIGGYVEYYTLTGSETENAKLSTPFSGTYSFATYEADVYDFDSHTEFKPASMSGTRYFGVVEGEEGKESEGTITIGGSTLAVVWLDEADIKEIDGNSSSLTSGFYAVSNTGTSVTVTQVRNTASEDQTPVFAELQTPDSPHTASETYADVREHIFGNHYVAELVESSGSYSLKPGAVLTKLDKGWDDFYAISTSEVAGENVDFPVAMAVDLENIGTSGDVVGTVVLTTYSPSTDSVQVTNGLYYSPGGTGDYYTYDGTDTPHSTTDLNGNYIVHGYNDNHYVAFELLGSGDLDDPYSIDYDNGIYLDGDGSTQFKKTDYDTLYDGGSGKDGTYDLSKMDNIYTFSADWTDDDGGTQASGSYVFYFKYNTSSGLFEGVKAKSVTDNTGWEISSNATEINVGSIDVFETLVTNLDASAYLDLSSQQSNNNNNNNNNNSGSVTTESLVLPFDTVVYSIDATDSGTSVSTSGLYVLKGSDTDGYDAYAVTGNSQVGYTVSKTADVADLYANAAAISAAATATDATKIDAVGELQVRIVEITTGQDNNSQNMNGLYAIKENGSAYDAYEVSVDGNGNYSVASTVAKTAVYADATALGDATDKVVGYLDVDAAPASYFAGTDDKSIFEIEAVDGERYGNIITYGVKLVDGHAGENVTLTSLQFDLSWDTGEYSYWGQFTPENASPSSLTYSAVDTSVFTPTTFFSEVGSTGVAFGMFDDAGMNFDQGEYVATFMLEKTSNTTSTDFDLTKAQYTLYDAYDSSNQQPEEQASTEKAFSFNPHTVTLKLETENDQSVSDVQLLTTNLTTNDGLSIVPVLKNGDIIQYQLVMNVPIPTFIQNADDSSVNINPNHKIDITGAKIFDKSITWLTDLAEGETSSLISDVNFAKSAKLDDGAAISAPSASVSNYTGHEFLDLALSTSNGRADLQTSDKLTFEFEGLTIPQLMAGTVPKDAEGRYILAEFSAVAPSSNSAIAFQSSQKSDENGAAWQAATVRNISREDETTGSPTAMDTGWVKTDAVSDGSEVVLLAEGWYMNERASNDAVGAEDALGALRVSRDGSNGNYSQAEIIASDFNLDGRVTAADAYDILQYSVAGPGSVDGAAKWVYIDNIDSNGATADNVHYDEVTDTFIGKDTTIDATAVLIGDVTSSYSGLTSDPTVGEYADWLEFISATYSPITISATGTADTYTGAVSSASDVIEITDTGRYDLTGTVSLGNDLVLDLDATSMAKIASAVDAETKAPISEASPDLVAKIDAIFGADDGTGATVTLAELTLVDTDNGDAETHIIAYDLNESGSFEAANDLMITYSSTDVAAAGFLAGVLEASPYDFSGYMADWHIS